MMDLQPPRSARNRYTSSDPDPGSSAGSSPSDPPRDRDASSSDNRRFESGSRCSLPTRPIPSPGSEEKGGGGVIPRAVITALLDQTEGSLIVIFDIRHREGSLQDGSRLPFDREGTILGHLPESADILRCFAPSGLPRLDKGSRSPDLILEFGQPEPITNDPRWPSPSFVDLA